MKFKKILPVLCIAGLLSACSDKDTTISPEDGASKTVYLKLTNALNGTKTDEASATGTTAPLLSAIIYFMDGGTDPVIEVVQKVGDESDADITIAQLEAGYEFMNIPSTVTQVFVVGNYNSSDEYDGVATFPTTRGTLFSQLEEVVLDIERVAYPRLNGIDRSQLLSVLTGSAFVRNYGSLPGGWHGDAPLTAEDMYADVVVAPINSRLEILQISYTGTNYTSFTLEGIYINNFFEKMPLNIQPEYPTYAPVNNGSDERKYDVTDNTNFAYKSYSTLYDILNEDVVVATSRSVTPANGTWAYHVFGNSSPVPHIILKLTDVTNTAGTNLGTRYVTVTGFREGAADIGTFERNVIYKINNLAFTDSDISTVPEPEEVNLWVHVSVQEWVTISVIPVI